MHSKTLQSLLLCITTLVVMIAPRPAAGQWTLNGNNAPPPNSVLGTTQPNQPLVLISSGQRAVRIELTSPGFHSPNLIGGSDANLVSPSSVFGATIGGGGALFGPQIIGANFATISGGLHNTNLGELGTIGGGSSNFVGNIYAFIGGGSQNINRGRSATIGGGWFNLSFADFATIGGGTRNTAENGSLFASIGGGASNVINTGSIAATIGGGATNLIMANVISSTIGGGTRNIIWPNSQFASIAGGRSNGIGDGSRYATISGGFSNSIGNTSVGATIPGGQSNLAIGNFTFAAGLLAQAIHEGAFVWADARGTPFTSTKPNQFLIRASNGVGIGTAAPKAGTQLDVNGTVRMTGLMMAPPQPFAVGDVLTCTDASTGKAEWKPGGGPPPTSPGWLLNGNDNIDAVNNYLGTTDAKPLELRVHKKRVMRYEEPEGWSLPDDYGINVIGGLNVNSVAKGVAGATIAGGAGRSPISCEGHPWVHLSYPNPTW